MSDWQTKWAIEIRDCSEGVGSKYQDPISDCVAEADKVIAQLEAENTKLKHATERLKGYRAKGAAICLEGAGCSNYTDELIAYADALEANQAKEKRNETE